MQMVKTPWDIPFPDPDIDFCTDIPGIRDQYDAMVVAEMQRIERELGFAVEVSELKLMDNHTVVTRLTWRKRD